MRSFYSEHTAEFVLVPKLKKIINTHYRIVVPIYFWKTREGNLLSSELHKGKIVKILAMFPRRSKIEGIKSPVVTGKINHSIITYSEYANDNGIPVLLGFPISRTLLDVGDPRCIWLQIKNVVPRDYIFNVEVSSNKLHFSYGHADGIIHLKESGIVDIIHDECKVVDWETAQKNMDILRNIGYQNDHHKRNFYFGGYKPVYFLIFI